MALADLAARTSDFYAVTCSFQCDKPVCVHDNQTATSLYHLSQEAVNNAVRHGHARNIFISLASDGDLVSLKIMDDGRGFPDTYQETAGTGLRIMRYRAELIGAKLIMGSTDPCGAQVACTFACRQAV